MADANSILVGMQENATNTTEMRDAFLRQLESGAQACLQDVAAAQPNSSDFELLVNTTRESLAAMGEFLPAEYEALLSSTEELAKSAASMEEDVENVKVGEWQSLIILIPFILSPAVLVVGVITAWCELDSPRFRFFLSWILLPFFIVQVIFAYSLSSAIVISASANADFCSGGESKTPDETVKEILLNLGYTTEDLTSSMLYYYIDQCSSGDPLAFLKTFQSNVSATNAVLAEWQAALNATDIASLSEECMRDVELVSDLTLRIKELIKYLDIEALELLYLFRCPSIVPLYTDPTYDGACDYSITGLTWAFSSFSVVAFMGLLMVTLRSSWNLDECETIISHVPCDESSKREGHAPDDEYGGYTGYDENNESFVDLVETGENDDAMVENSAGGEFS